MSSRAEIMKKAQAKTYLGDHVYASFNGFQYVLSTSDNVKVHLDPRVLIAFDHYRKHCEALMQEYGKAGRE